MKYVSGNVVKIENREYEDKNITEVILSPTTEEVGEYAFAHNADLKSVVIPKNIKALGQDAFGYTGLETVELENANVRMERYTFRSSPVKNLIIHSFDKDEIDRILCSFDKGNLQTLTLKDDFATVTIPYRYLSQRAGGINRNYKIQLLLEAVRQGITLNYEITRLLYKEVHNYQAFDEDTIQKVLKKFENYGVSGILRCNTDYEEDTLEALKKGFKEKFGVVPRIVKDIAICSKQFGISSEELIKAFNIDKTKSFIKAGIPTMEGILSEIYIKDNYLDFISKPYFATLTLCMYEALTSRNAASVRDWVLAHKDTKDEFIIKVLTDRKYLSLESKDTVDAVRQKLSNVKSLGEIKKIEHSYSKVGFEFINCKTDIKHCETITGKYKCETLKAGDSRMATIGYDTDCCQHLGGAGETAMMLGIASPKAGFWVLSNKDTGQVLAQAEVWEQSGDDSILVFDNIEFANDADIKLYFDAIKDWCEKSEYKTILMGVGYNQMARLKNFELINNDLAFFPDIDARTLQILDNGEDFYDIGDCEEYLESPDFSTMDMLEEYLYSDALNELAVLKVDGRVSTKLKTQKQIERD